MFETFRRKLHVILDTMAKDWSDGIAIHSDVSTMIRHANLSRQCSNVMITTNALSVFFYTIGGPILRSVIHKNDQETITRELPIKMEFPFNVDNSPIFELVLIVQLFHDLSVACIIAMLNALLVTLVSFEFELSYFMYGTNFRKLSKSILLDLYKRNRTIVFYSCI